MRNIKIYKALVKLSSGFNKKQATDEFIIEKSVIDYVDMNEDNAQGNTTPATKGTTIVYIIKFINSLLNVMDLNKSLKNSYLMTDNCIIQKD
ncbi:hypothetical protein BCV71DRAFT_190704 [Rhizopus microsporus]|uniref:Uncharacterized protein n=1 Tax=Rhizopus microsporus TaxID=58291 RepID=A0A1X0RL38_RHIZD|nr:hypothetical protein BCV71DRAFT_190704 [Rhizopus microsporus]